MIWIQGTQPKSTHNAEFKICSVINGAGFGSVYVPQTRPLIPTPTSGWLSSAWSICFWVTRIFSGLQSSHWPGNRWRLALPFVQVRCFWQKQSLILDWNIISIFCRVSITSNFLFVCLVMPTSTKVTKLVVISRGCLQHIVRRLYFIAMQLSSKPCIYIASIHFSGIHSIITPTEQINPIWL